MEDIQPVSSEEAGQLARAVPLWKLEMKFIDRQFRFKDFRQAMAFVNKIADAAERRDHHPDIFISWNKVTLTLTTHKIGGLSRADFELAAEIDGLAAASGAV